MFIAPIKTTFDLRYKKYNHSYTPRFTSQYLLYEDIDGLIKEGKMDDIKRLPDIYIINNKRESLLHSATQNNQLEISKYLLYKNLNPNLKNHRGRTPFAIACSKLNKPLIEAFLLYDIDVNTFDNQKNTPLHKVVTEPQLVKLLLDHSANPYFENDFNQSPFGLSIKYPKSLETFLKCGTNPNAADNKSQTLMHIAMQKDNLEAAEILKKYKADVNFIDNHGKSPIFYTTKPQNVEWLFKNGANLNLQDKNRKTVLHQNVINNDFNITKNLLKLGANPNIADNQNLPPLAYVKGTKMMDLLLRHKANPDIITPNGSTLLHNCVRTKNLNAVQLLLKYNANPNIPDRDRKIPFDYALNIPSLRLLLLNAGSNPNYRNYIVSALKSGNMNFLTELLEHGADPNKPNLTGKTSAFFVNKPEQIEKLKEYNVNLNAYNNDGYTPILHFTLLGRVDIVEMLKMNGAEFLPSASGQTYEDCAALYRKYHKWLKQDNPKTAQVSFEGNIDSNNYRFYGNNVIRENLLYKLELTPDVIDEIIQSAPTTEHGIINAYKRLREEEAKIIKNTSGLSVIIAQFNEDFKFELQRLYSRNPKGSKFPYVGIISQYFGTILTNSFENNLIAASEEVQNIYNAIRDNYFGKGIAKQLEAYNKLNRYLYDGVKYVNYIEGKNANYEKILQNLDNGNIKLTKFRSKWEEKLEQLGYKYREECNKMIDFQREKQAGRTAKKTATLIVGGSS